MNREKVKKRADEANKQVAEREVSASLHDKLDKIKEMLDVLLNR